MKSEKDIFKKANETLDKAVEQAYHIDNTSEDFVIDNEQYNWDNLQKLREEMVDSVMKFVVQVQSLVTSKEILENLSPESSSKLSKVATVFFKDIESFSVKMSELYDEHKELKGFLNGMPDFDKYNRLAVKYHALYTELGSLVPPAVAEMMLIVHEAQLNREAQDTSVVTDLEPKQPQNTQEEVSNG